MEKSMVLLKSTSINYNEALNRMGGDEIFLFELFDDFISEFGKYYRTLVNGVLQNDYEVITVTGHTLKGSSAMLSLKRMNQLSAQLEIAGNSENMKKIKILVKQIGNEFSSLETLFSKSQMSSN